MARRKLKKVIKKSPRQLVSGKPKVETDRIKKTKTRVIGIGGGGSSIVSEIASKIKKATFLVANTDRQALIAASRRADRFRFGQSFTQGLGTGMNAELGREAAQNEKEKIKKLLEGQDFCILVACLGGGAGSGAAPVFAKISKNVGNITLGIFTLPFKFEGEKKMEIAKDSLEKLKPNLNAIAIIPNERIFQIIDKKTPLKGALSAINKSLAESLEGLIEMIYEPGLINIDFADLRTILGYNSRTRAKLGAGPSTIRYGKLAYLNTVAVQKKGHSPEEVIKKVLSCPLYSYSIRGAKGVLFNIAGEKDLELSEVNQISKTISELVNPEAKIIFGISQNKKYRDIIKTTLLATGCGAKIGAQFMLEGRRVSRGLKKRKRLQPTRHPRTTSRRLKKEKKKASVPQKPVPKIKKKLKIKAGKKLKRPKAKKIKIEVPKESKEKIISPSEVEPKKNEAPNPLETKVRKNALQIKKESEAEEEEMLAKEKFWETPAFLRRKDTKS